MKSDGTPCRPLVTVTGGAGYVGSVVVRQLLELGHRVRVLDSFLFGNGSLAPLESDSRLEVIHGDVRSRQDLDRALGGSSAVLHLAGLVGDPACALDPDFTRAVNQDSNTLMARACIAHEIPRLVLASTCSVYGAAGDQWLDENSRTAPVSLYAETNLRAEEILRDALEGTGTTLSILRFATIFGLSSRMRFDLVVNLLTARAVTERSIEVHGGEQWRPQVHVGDVARALLLAMDKPPGLARDVFNVGANEQNYRIADLAGRIADTFPGTEVRVLDVRDPRSYRVSFSRIRDRLGFTAVTDIVSGAREVADFLDREKADAQETRFHNDRALSERLKDLSR